jgi:hypothetical protein
MALGALVRLAALATLPLALMAIGRDGYACDSQTDQWVRDVTSYWHGALGRADFCNNTAIGANRQMAADCAWIATSKQFGNPPDPACARAAIEGSTQGKADLDEFVRKWEISLAQLQQVHLPDFNIPPQIFSCSVVEVPRVYKCVEISALDPYTMCETPAPKTCKCCHCSWFDQPPETRCTWRQSKTLSWGDIIQVSAEGSSSPGTVGIILQVSDRLKTWKALSVRNGQISVQGRGESFPFTPELRSGTLTVDLAAATHDWLIFATSTPDGPRNLYRVDVAELAAYSGRTVVFRWVEECCAYQHIDPDGRYAIPSGAPYDGAVLQEPDGALWVVFDATRYRAPDQETLTRVYNRVIFHVPQGEPAQRLRAVPRDGTLLREESGTVWIIYGGAKFHVPDPATLDRLFAGRPLYPLWDNALTMTPDAPSDGTLLREENGRIWIVFGRAKFHVPDPATLNRLYSERPVLQLWDGALDALDSTPVDGTLLREENGSIWIVFGRAKFHVPDPATLNRLYLGRPILQVWDGALDALGSIPIDGTFLREESDTLPYLIVNGHKVRPTGIDADAVRVLWNGALAGIP